MIHLRPYASSDEARLLPFLHDFNPHIGPESWRKLLGYQWENSEGFNGMLLENEGAIVGFLSYVISRNIHNGRELTHCNLSSWIVLPEYRSKSMQLLSKAFTINNVLVLNLTPHEHTRPMFRGLRFETLAEWEFRINPFRLAYAREAKEEKLDVTCTPVKAGTSEYNALSGEQKTMLRDHLPYTNVRFYRFGTGRENLVLAFNEKRMAPAGWKNRLKELPYTLSGKTLQSELLYSSSKALLSAHFTAILRAYTRAAGIRSVNISEHFVNAAAGALSYVTKDRKPAPWLWYSELPLDPAEIHVLYTEKVILNF